jgi:hypothetical protein
MLVGKGRLDFRLRLTEPISGGVEFVFVDLGEVADDSEGRCGGVFAELSGGCQFSRGFETRAALIVNASLATRSGLGALPSASR